MLTLDDGLRVRITHYRVKQEVWDESMTDDRLIAFPSMATSVYELLRQGYPLGRCSNWGGITVAEIIDGETVVATGKAYCRLDENFNKAIGRTIALGRARKALADSREPAAVH